jgi:methionyl-tRNA formyltransferase
MVSIAFLGSHTLGVECLSRLADAPAVSVEVVCTYPPDHEGWWDGSVYDLAERLGYPILTLDEEDRLFEYPVDYLLSVYYPAILGADLLFPTPSGERSTSTRPNSPAIGGRTSSRTRS